jgi:hypothetical protein
MGVDVYRPGGKPMGTQSLKSDKQCANCLQRFKVLEMGPDGKWSCHACLGIDEPLIYEVVNGEDNS